MARNRRPSPQTLAVLVALAEDPSTWRYGYALCQQLDIKAGSMYPILMRLSDRGWLETTWESDAPHGRPPRHLYRLTEEGLTRARQATAVAPSRARLQPA